MTGINHDRRRFIGAAVITLAGTKLSALTMNTAQSSREWAVKQIDAGLLNVGYTEARG